MCSREEVAAEDGAVGEGEVEADDLVVAVDEDRMDPKARTAAPIQVTIHEKGPSSR